MEYHNLWPITSPTCWTVQLGPFTLEYSLHPRFYRHHVISQIYEIYYNKSIDWKICKTTIARIRLKIQSLSHQTNYLLSPDFVTIIRYQDLLPGLIPSSSTLFRYVYLTLGIAGLTVVVISSRDWGTVIAVVVDGTVVGSDVVSMYS